MKEKHIEDCYKYTLDRLKELSAGYTEQVNNTEDFALWNLPTELCDDWYNMEYFINRRSIFTYFIQMQMERVAFCVWIFNCFGNLYCVPF